MHCCGKHIQSLIHTFCSHNLRSKKFPCILFKNNLHGHNFCTGIITCMRSWRKDNTFTINSHRFSYFLSQTSSCNSHIKYLYYGGTHRTLIMAIPSTDIICCNTSLLIRRSCKCNYGIFFCHKMFHLNSITCSINILYRGFHTIIYDNTSFYTKL